jgi:hypothetical protein
MLIPQIKVDGQVYSILIKILKGFDITHNTVKDFKSIEGFLDKLPDSSYEYAIEFKHPSWGTEGPWEMLSPL